MNNRYAYGLPSWFLAIFSLFLTACCIYYSGNGLDSWTWLSKANLLEVRFFNISALYLMIMITYLTFPYFYSKYAATDEFVAVFYLNVAVIVTWWVVEIHVIDSLTMLLVMGLVSALNIIFVCKSTFEGKGK